MGSMFDEVFAESGSPGVLDALGESVIYTQSGVPKSITAVASPEYEKAEDDGDSMAYRVWRDFTFATTDGVGQPAYDDTVTVGEDVYAVRLVEHTSPSLYRVSARKQFGNSRVYTGPELRR